MSYEAFLNENFLLPLKVTRNWMIVKNYLYNVDLQWLNSLDDDEKFDVIDAYFYTNIFYASSEVDVKSVRYKLILDVYIIPIIENDIYLDFEYELTVNLINLNKKNESLDTIEFEVKKISNLSKIIDKFMFHVSLDLVNHIESNDFKISIALEGIVNSLNLGEKIIKV
ncbi:hypothetical protein [Acinetobacter bereziniae]|uniref:hypothetical protein n=1 Tax=Acinetobacter bereziniae TaxID=106648 RepID=UPI00073EB1A1|nr:hypothetical protein [Acinetobacter bereziniae]MCU4538291.1 hypothetical protein [Acinetobacter bereziniae]RSZ27361.1 hypothetical protein NDM229_015950 [Acinetobacter bereziniae]